MNRLGALGIAFVLGGVTNLVSAATLSLSASQNPSTFGQNVTITATLSGYFGGNAVTFYDGPASNPNNAIGSVNVGGSGTTRIVQLNKGNFSAGTHNLNAVCCNDLSEGNYSGSTTLTVNKATPTVTLSVDPLAAFTTDSISLTANVPVNVTGSITFLDGNSAIAQQSLFGSSVTTNVVLPAPGSHSITAQYNGDGNNNSSTSSPKTVQISLTPTTTTLTSSANPSSPGQSVTFTIKVQPNGPFGTITIRDGQNSIGTVNLTNPTVTFNTSSLSSGSHSLTASFPGDNKYAPSTSTALTQTVGGGGTSTITSLSPSTAAAGGPGFTLTVNGTGFSQGAAAQWNGTALTTTFVSATQLTAAVPNTLLASAGTAVIKVGNSNGAFFTVNPPGQSCTFTFAPPSASFGSAGGPGTSAVTASRTDCSWLATRGPNDTWITFPGGAITGSGTLNYNVAPNPGATSRRGTITVGFQSFTVTQGGTSCKFNLPGASLTFGPAGGSGTAVVQAPPGCNWASATDGASFVTIAAPGAGSGNGTVSFTVAANSTGAPRSSTLTIANQPFTVAQSATGSTVKCAVSSTTAAPQVELETLTAGAGGITINCTGFTTAIKADITLTLNTNVTNPLNGTIDPLLTINGGAPIVGKVTGYNLIRWRGVSLSPVGGAVNMTIAQVCANANLLGTPNSTITGQISIGALALVPLTGALQTMANIAPSMIFNKLQASPPSGGARTQVPLVFQESPTGAFQPNSTRFRVVLSNLPAAVQVLAPVFPAEGASRAQLFSADANGSGGSPIAGSPIPEGTYQQLTVTGGTAMATWAVLAADPAQTETWTFPLVLLNVTTGDLNQITASGSLAPVSDVNLSDVNSPVPRFRDLGTAIKLTNLRLTTSVQVTPPGASVAGGKTLLQARAASSPKDAVDVGSKVTFTHQLVNDTSDQSQAATNVVIRDNLPSGLNLISCTATGASCGGSGGDVQVTFPNIAPGQTTTVTVVAQVDPAAPAGALVENPVVVSSDQVNQDLQAATASSSFIIVSGVPVAVGHTPASGSGNTQNFTFQFSHPSGFQNLGVVNILINNFLDGRSACYLAYVVQNNNLLLVDDGGHAGGPFAGSIVLGDSTPIQNSQCSVVLTNALGNGNTLTLNLNITFKPAFGGNRIVFVAARDQASANTDWQALGVWQVPFTSPVAITVTGVNPPRDAGAGGANKQFTFSFTDTNGVGNFGIVNVLVNRFIDGRNACYLAFVVASNKLFLVNDAGDAGGPFAGQIVINGPSASMENSQCQVSTAGSTVSFAPNTMNLTLNITFKPAFAGNRVFFVAGRDTADGNNTDWQAVGTYSVQ